MTDPTPPEAAKPVDLDALKLQLAAAEPFVRDGRIPIRVDVLAALIAEVKLMRRIMEDQVDD